MEQQLITTSDPNVELRDLEECPQREAQSRWLKELYLCGWQPVELQAAESIRFGNMAGESCGV